MASSESKRRTSTMLRCMSRQRTAELLLLLVVSFFAIAAEAVGHKVVNGKVLDSKSGILSGRQGADHPRKPLLRQEFSISPRGGLAEQGSSALEHGRRSEHRSPNTTLSHEEGVAMPEDKQKFTTRCADYPRDLSGDSADPVSTGEYLCGGDTCQEAQFPEAKDRCCNCNGGSQFRLYENTQCVGESGLSRSGDYNGVKYSNPQPFTDVMSCMETCWSMGEDCTAISVVNENSAFSGKCFFRKGALKYVHDYRGCSNSTCEQRSDEVDDGIIMTTTQPPSNDTRLAFCDDEAAFENTPCTDNPDEARPRTITTSPPPPPNQDEVVDSRDCAVKYLYWR